MHITCIHAHPDDAEILAGGTLALLATRGHHVTIVTMTPGDCGSAELGRERIASVRTGEAQAAAALIGADYLCAGFSDLCIFNDDPSRRRVTAVLRRLRPDIVLTASPSDYLCDHEATSQLVRDACFAGSVPNYSVNEDLAPLDKIPYLYFLDPIEGIDRSGNVVNPDFTVDVTTTFATKNKMLAQHASQRAWLKQQHGMDDYLLAMERWTRSNGVRAGVQFGEGLRQYTVHPYPTDNVLAELLAQWVVWPGATIEKNPGRP